MTDKFQVSQSKVKSWLQCRQAYHYKYVDKLSKKAKGRPLMFGDIMHQLLEASTEQKDWLKVLRSIEKERGKLFSAEREEYGDIIEDCQMIFQAYLDYYEGDKLRYLLYSGKRTEHWIETDLSRDIRLVLKVDAFARTRNKLRWLVENKTGKQVPEEDERWRNLQTSVYLTAAEKIGIEPFDGILWNFIRSKSPTVPQLLKNRTLSIRNIDTLPNMVMRTILEHKLDPKDHKELIKRAKQNVSTYFFRDFQARKEGTVKLLFKDFVETSQEMMEFHGKRKQKNIGKHCAWCDFEKICRAELTGGDVDYVKEREYTVGNQGKAKTGKKDTRKRGRKKDTR